VRKRSTRSQLQDLHGCYFQDDSSLDSRDGRCDSIARFRKDSEITLLYRTKLVRARVCEKYVNTGYLGGNASPSRPQYQRQQQVSPAQDSDKIQICKIVSATLDLQFNETSREILDILVVPVPLGALEGAPQGLTRASSLQPACMRENAPS